MKKVFTLVCVLACTMFANAQDREFKPFKVDLALGYAIPSGSSYDGGALFSVEPKYAIMDQLAVGFRFELAFLARVAPNGTSADVKGIGSYSPTLDYYFGTNKSRVFVGAGAGLYQFAAGTYDDNTSTTTTYPSYSKFGFFPRVGAELAHFRVAAEYNIVPKEGTVSNGYLSIKVGVFIGGGKN